MYGEKISGFFYGRCKTHSKKPGRAAIDGTAQTAGQRRLGPGHCPGHLCYFNREEGVLFTGDTLFRESIGRTDLLGGDYDQSMESIVKKILSIRVTVPTVR